MTGSSTGLDAERAYSVIAASLSGGRRRAARLVSGERRSFGLDPSGCVVDVPHPAVDGSWTERTLTCGVALQCSPSKDRIREVALADLSDRQLAAVSVAEGRVAAGWIAQRWPGLVPELRRVAPGLTLDDPDLSAPDIVARAVAALESGDAATLPAVLGRLPVALPPLPGGLAAARRRYGRMPFSTTRKDKARLMSIPVGGDGGVKNPNLPPPSRPGDEEAEVRTDRRTGIPYPEWNMWSESFLPNHVAVLERRHPSTTRDATPAPADIRRWFAEHTHRAMRTSLEDGSDLDADRYVAFHVDSLTGITEQPRVFRDLRPAFRDVTTAVLLDGSSSLGGGGGATFRLELACADALSNAMTLGRERHGIFIFSGNTRHRVDIRCLKDFHDPRFVAPSGQGLSAGGYTRLGAPIRHLTTRLLAQPSERRQMIVLGDGMISDDGYEGRYAWADVAHAVTEATEAGVSVYYLGLGPARVDPLPTVFGPERSQRIHRVGDLPRVLAHVHRELVST